MDMLWHQGFLRSKRGLNQLETIQAFAKILKQPNDEFEIDYCCKNIDTHRKLVILVIVINIT